MVLEKINRYLKRINLIAFGSAFLLYLLITIVDDGNIFLVDYVMNNIVGEEGLDTLFPIVIVLGIVSYGTHILTAPFAIRWAYQAYINKRFFLSFVYFLSAAVAILYVSLFILSVVKPAPLIIL